MAAGMGLIGTGGRRVTACGTSRPQLPSSIHTTLSTAHDQNPDPTRYKTDFSEPLRTIEIKSNGELQMEFNAQMEVKHCVTGGLAHRSGVRTSFKLVAFQGMKICDGFTRDEIITRIQREPRPWRFTFGNCQSATVDAGSAKCASAVDPEILHKTEPADCFLPPQKKRKAETDAHLAQGPVGFAAAHTLAPRRSLLAVEAVQSASRAPFRARWKACSGVFLHRSRERGPDSRRDRADGQG